MLARQITADLQTVRGLVQPGQSKPLISKGIGFGVLRRGDDGRWDTSQVQGISPLSLKTKGPENPPSLVIRPFHPAGNVISLREFTNNAFNHHHGMQSEERFGKGTDPDGDEFSDELTRADITATTVFQATLPVPGRVIPDDREFQEAIAMGESRFKRIGCAKCHISALPLDNKGWIYTEPNPYNSVSVMQNLRLGEAPTLSVDLTSSDLPQPRLKPKNGVTWICITPTPNQFLYSSDAFPGRIYKLTLDGKLLGVLGKSGKQLKEFGWIHEIACPAENELYVSEILNWRVQKLVLERSR